MQWLLQQEIRLSASAASSMINRLRKRLPAGKTVALIFGEVVGRRLCLRKPLPLLDIDDMQEEQSPMMHFS